MKASEQHSTSTIQCGFDNMRGAIFFSLVLLACQGQEPPPLSLDNTAIVDVPGRADVNPISWTDSYSVGDSCFCRTTFDHDIGDFIVDIAPFGNITVRQACEALGAGPGAEGRPVYNDIQCGNGPPNTAADETECPGRTDHGQEGCKYIGPMWNFPLDAVIKPDKSAATVSMSAGVVITLMVVTVSFEHWFLS